MKPRPWCLIAILLLASLPLLAAPANRTMEQGYSFRHDLSPPLTELVKIAKPAVPARPREIPLRTPDLKARAHAPALAFDPLVGPVQVQAPMPPPIISFPGPDADALETVTGGRVNPPDTNGDVGPNHYISYVNLIWQIFDKSTGASVLGPFAGNSFWAGFGGVCESTNDGDPVVLWDQFAGRWLVSQFAIYSGVQCVAISQTGDPTGSWHRYAFDVSAGLNDYPKIGVWPDAYYLTFNEFNASGSAYLGSAAVALDKASMIAGVTASFIRFNNYGDCAGTGDCYYSVLPAHVEGIVPPPVGTPNYFVMAFDDEVWGGSPVSGTDYYKIWEFHVDWTTPANSTFTGPVSVPSAEFNGQLCGFNRSCIPQPSPGEGLDSLGQFTMYRAVYRNFGTHDAMYLSHTTNLNPSTNQAGIRWAEVRDLATTPAIFQAGTHAPADAHSRWMGSMAADKDGNIALGYSISSSTKMPSIGVAGRLAADPVGTLPQEELEFLTGTGVQVSSANRWGDYSTMSVDESDNCTFWYTQEYYATTGGWDWDTQIASFKFPSCTNGPTGTITGTVTSASSGLPIVGASVVIGGLYATTTNGSGVYSLTLPIGTYDVVASKYGYGTETATGVVIATDQTTTQDFALTPSASVMLDGFVVAGGGGAWPLYAEVTVNTPAGPVEVYTNPQNGYYSIELLADTAFTITVEAEQPGWAPASRSIVTTINDMQENFVLSPDANCTLPGYEIQFGDPLVFADFNSGIPAGFNVTTLYGCGWGTGNPGGRSNMTGGSGLFAIADGDWCYDPTDTYLETPAFDLSSSSGTLRIQFNSDYYDLCSGSDAVALEIWNGAAWSTVYNFCGTSRRGPRLEAFNTQVANGAADAKVRWRYKAGWDWWWEVDNVLIANATCTLTTPGGVIYGNVYDENTGLPLNGALVTIDGGLTTYTGPTPDDPAIDDGFFVIFAPLGGNAPGVRNVTVEMPNYGTVTHMVVPTPGSSVKTDFILPAGMLSSPNTALRMRLPINGTGDTTLTVNNVGNLDANVSILELNAPVPPAPAGPIQDIPARFDMTTKQGILASQARNTRGIELPNQPQAPTTLQSGEFVAEYATGLALPWGIGYDLDADDYWVGNPAAGGGDDLHYRFLNDGTPTGDTIDISAIGAGYAADMAYNSRTRTIWQVNVITGTCIFEIDPIGKVLTGNQICPAFGTSMRGLAYNPVSNTYYSGSWNNGAINEFTPEGTILRYVSVGLPVAGLAYNPSTGHLFVQVNDANQIVWVLDANTPTFSVVTAFPLKNSTGGNAFDAYAGAGLEMDCAGKLWAVNQNSLTVFVNDSGESDVCVTQIPWLTEDPTDFVVPATGSTDSAINFNAAGQTPGCQEAQLLLLNDTPYGPLQIPAGLTVAFNDVPFGAFGDAYIHAIAGAGISLGCGGGNFCPAAAMTRRTMSIWLLRGKLGSDYAPPPATGIFADVSPESFAADWIEDLYHRGITSGCVADPLQYCPEDTVTRLQMAIFLLRSKEGSDYVPDLCEGLFADMTCDSPNTKWAEELYRRGVTSGCVADPLQYCPSDPTTRGQMSIFAARMFEIPICNQ